MSEWNNEYARVRARNIYIYIRRKKALIGARARQTVLEVRRSTSIYGIIEVSIVKGLRLMVGGIIKKSATLARIPSSLDIVNRRC